MEGRVAWFSTAMNNYIVYYSQYELKRGYEHTIGWLPRRDLALGTRVKVDDDPFWWTIVGKGEVFIIKDETPQIEYWI